MENSLYTFILDYRGGTYISQFRGASPEEALENWAAGVDLEVMGLKEKQRTKLRDEANLDGLTALTGVTQVWCVGLILKKKFALLNMVRTNES